MLKAADFELVICDRSRCDNSLDELLRSARRQAPPTSVILLGEPAPADTATELDLQFECDYLPGPLTSPLFLSKVESTLEHRRLRYELTTLRTHVAMNFGFDNVVGISKVMSQLKETAARIAPTDISILITGPSGSGKELFARTIHHHSERRRRRFEAVDCSAIPEAQIGTELFGSGANTTTATTLSRRGRCVEADGGTLFLEEVACIPPTIQAKLVQFLQDGLVHPVGSGELRKVDVRVIASSGDPLQPLVADGRFREDLYYKLAVIPLVMPPLAERADDIEMLIDYFLRRLRHELARPELTITRAAVDKLLTHRWPGNVRELENILKRAATLSNDNVLDTPSVTFVTYDATPSTGEAIPEGSHSLVLKGGLLDHNQREVIVRALDDNRWNFTRTAAALGIGRTTLWRKIKKYNLAPVGTLSQQD